MEKLIPGPLRVNISFNTRTVTAPGASVAEGAGPGSLVAVGGGAEAADSAVAVSCVCVPGPVVGALVDVGSTSLVTSTITVAIIVEPGSCVADGETGLEGPRPKISHRAARPPKNASAPGISQVGRRFDPVVSIDRSFPARVTNHSPDWRGDHCHSPEAVRTPAAPKSANAWSMAAANSFAD